MTLMIFLNGKIIESRIGQEISDGRDSIKATFDQVGCTWCKNFKCR